MGYLPLHRTSDLAPLRSSNIPEIHVKMEVDSQGAIPFVPEEKTAAT